MSRCLLSHMQSADSIPSPRMTPLPTTWIGSQLNQSSSSSLQPLPTTDAGSSTFFGGGTEKPLLFLFSVPPQRDAPVGGRCPISELGKGILRNLPAGSGTRTLWREGLLGLGWGPPKPRSLFLNSGSTHSPVQHLPKKLWVQGGYATWFPPRLFSKMGLSNIQLKRAPFIQPPPLDFGQSLTQPHF